MEAVDNLATVVDIDIAEVEAEQGEQRLRTLAHINSQSGKRGDFQRIRQSFKTIHNYLKKLHKKDPKDLKDIDIQKGVHAIMTLADEAAEKIDRCNSLFAKAHGKSYVSLSDEYKDLQKFYHEKLIKRFKSVLDAEDAWLEELVQEKDVKDVQKVGLRDLETVKKDRDYELLYLVDSDGQPYYNKNLVRHIKLVADFDEIAFIYAGDDPLLKVKEVQDRDAHETAREIFDTLEGEISDFYRDALKFKEHSIVSYLNMGLMALRMAAKDRHMIRKTFGKSCLVYFYDFLFYLREAFATTPYQKILENEKDRLLHATIDLMHKLCYQIYTRGALKGEMGLFVYNLIHTSDDEVEKHSGDFLSFLTHIIDCHDDIQSVLRKYPNGPLFKTLDIMQSDQRVIGWDPFLQENLPGSLYTVTAKGGTTEIIRMACPTHQEKVETAFVIPEFLGFLRQASLDTKKDSLLLFNFQDRTNWRDFARCIAVESVPNGAEFAKFLTVVTFPKNTDFYHQTAEYLKESCAKTFMTTLTKQIDDAEACGFSLPTSRIPKKEFTAFAKSCIKAIHSHLFEGKKELQRWERLDFIELFFQLLQFMVLDKLSPSLCSYMSKDSLDIGASATAGAYLFINLLQKGSKLTEEDKDLVMYMLFAPALFVRERPIDMQCLSRMISFLTTLATLKETKRSDLFKEIEPLFSKGFFKSLRAS